MNRLFYAACLLVTVASTNSYGQRMVAEVPFKFQMGKSLMPAGKYIVKESGNLLTVQSASGKSTAIMFTLPASRAQKREEPTLEFQRYENDYFLTKIWDANSDSGRALLKSKREKELARRLTFKHTDEVALQKKDGPAQDPR